MPLFLVRHGQSEWNARGRIQGRADSPLTALGREQARLIGKHLQVLFHPSRHSSEPFEPQAEPTLPTIFSSPLGRATETSAIIASYLGGGISGATVDQRLTDFNLGELTGFDGWDRVAAEHPHLARARLHDPLAFHPPGGESGADVVARLSSFLDDLPDDGTAQLIVCHGVINKFIRSIRRGLSGADIIALGESQYTVYRLDGSVEQAVELDVAEECT